MASPEISARLRYLNDSAHLLALTASETSKYLMSRHNALMFENNIEQSDSQRREACGACGAIMVFGWGCTLQIENQRSQRDKKRSRHSGESKHARAMVSICGSCGRKTRHRLNVNPTRHKSGSSRSISLSAANQASPLQVKSTPNTTTTTTSSTNSSSRKRAKARKQSGLEAILARQRATTEANTSGFGLDLMDFIKKT